MSKSHYIPRPEYQLMAWVDNFISTAQPSHGASEEGLARLKVLGDALHAKMAAADKAALLAKQAVAEKKLCRQQLDELIRAEVRRIKAHADYNPALGQQLGIEGAEQTFDLETMAPTLTAIDKTGGKLVISFIKGKSDGINLYCQRENNDDWVLLGRATQSPYIDDRPLLQVGKPELRRYSAVFMHHDNEVGNFSPEIVVSCSP